MERGKDCSFALNDAVVTSGVAAADGATAALRTGDDLASIIAILQQDAASGR